MSESPLGLFNGGSIFSMIIDGLTDGGAPDLQCSCGDEFGEYMNHAVASAFPWNPLAPVARDVTEVWSRRRLLVLPEAGGNWLPARVHKLREWNQGPWSSCANWDIDITYDDELSAAVYGLTKTSRDVARPQREPVVGHCTHGNIFMRHDRRLRGFFDGPALEFAHLDNLNAQELLEALSQMPYRDVQRCLRSLGLPASGSTQVLKSRLFDEWRTHAEAQWDAEDDQAWANDEANRVWLVRERAIREAVDRRRERERSPSPGPRPRPVRLSWLGTPLWARLSACLGAADVLWATGPGEDMPSPPVSYRIIRASVNTGGTLHDNRPGKEGQLLSFKWAEPALPALDVREGLPCPICRAKEPPTAGLGKYALSVGDCPVCLSTGIETCIRLSCRHTLCRNCWTQIGWADEQTSSPAADPDADDDNPNLLGSMLEPLMPAEIMTATELNPAQMAAQRSFLKEVTDKLQEQAAAGNPAGLERFLHSCIHNLLHEANAGGAAGMLRLRRKLQIMPIVACMNESARRTVERHGSIRMLETFVDVLPERRACIRDQMEKEGKLSEEEMGKALEHWVSKICCRVGELYEAKGRYLFAIPWYQRCVEISGGGRFGVSDEANDLSNLGVAQKRAGLWREAMASYDASLLVWCEGEDSQEAVLGEGKVCASNRQTLVREVRHWTGTALEFELDDDAEDQIREQINAASPPHDQLCDGYYSPAQKAALARDRALAHHRRTLAGGGVRALHARLVRWVWAPMADFVSSGVLNRWLSYLEDRRFFGLLPPQAQGLEDLDFHEWSRWDAFCCLVLISLPVITAGLLAAVLLYLGVSCLWLEVETAVAVGAVVGKAREAVWYSVCGMGVLLFGTIF